MQPDMIEKFIIEFLIESMKAAAFLFIVATVIAGVWIDSRHRKP